VAARRLYAWRRPAALGAYRVVSSRARCRLERARSRVYRRVGNRSRPPRFPDVERALLTLRSCPGPLRLRCADATAGRYRPSVRHREGRVADLRCVAARTGSQGLGGPTACDQCNHAADVTVSLDNARSGSAQLKRALPYASAYRRFPASSSGWLTKRAGPKASLSRRRCLFFYVPATASRSCPTNPHLATAATEACCNVGRA
jgi:hypothetical protein